MSKREMLVFVGCLALLMTAASCPKKRAKVPMEPIPQHKEEVKSKDYYDVWVQCEEELEECVNLCDDL